MFSGTQLIFQLHTCIFYLLSSSAHEGASEQRICKKVFSVYSGERMARDHDLTKLSKPLPSLPGASGVFQWACFSTHAAKQKKSYRCIPTAVANPRLVRALVLTPREKPMLWCLELILIYPLWNEGDLENPSISEILASMCGWRHKLWSQTAWLQVSALPPTSCVTVAS